MSQESLSPFHAELLGFLQKDLARQSEELGESRDLDQFRQTLREALSPGSADQPLPLSEIIDNYQHLFNERGKTHIEQRLIETLSFAEFSELGFAAQYPRVVRGLPRIYQKDLPAHSRVKKNFSHLPTLRKLAVDKALFHLYAAQPVEGRAVLFGWVMNDGLGDYIALWEMAQLIKKRFPLLDLHLVALISAHAIQKVEREAPFSVHLIPYEKEPSLSAFPEKVLSIFRSSDYVLQTPTFFADTESLLASLRPGVQMDCLGEYGFLESSWFHPRTGNRSLGLHFLEKGILTRTIPAAEFCEVENRELIQLLFETDVPGPLEVDRYLQDHHFYLSYLTTPVGGAVYLHALLKALERDGRNIDLCVPDIGWLIRYGEERDKKGKPLIEGDFAVDRIELYIYGKRCVVPVTGKGKRLRIICPEKLSAADFRRLMSLSGEFVGVRGDQSFSEAVSANKAFFYDGREHARYFFKDLLALAQNRIGAHRGTLACFQGMVEAFLHNLPEQTQSWVDESYFQVPVDWFETAMKVGAGLQNLDTVAGYKKFNRLLIQEFSANEYICNLFQRAFCHKKRPDVAALEAELMGLFGEGTIRFKAVVEALQKRI